MQLGRESENNDKGSPLLLQPQYFLQEPDDAGEKSNEFVELTYTQTDKTRRPSVMRNIAGFIIITEFCERLAYYGFAGSLVLLFQTQLNLSNEAADVQYSAWSSACYVTPLLGGYLADAYLGRYLTIVVFCSFYVFGLVLIVLGCIPNHTSTPLIFMGMYIIALASGGIKPNVSTMGADQFDDKYAQDRKEKESFFNWFYWSINLGALISYTLISYICQFGIPALGGLKWGFFVGYSIPAITMGIALATFISGSRRYKVSNPQGSVLTVTAKICYEALWSRSNSSIQCDSILDRANRNYGGSFNPIEVEAVKLVLRTLPFGLAMLPYWSVYSQMSTGFQNQGCQMQLKLGDIPVPVSALNMFDTVIILLFVPVFDGVVYPFLKKNNLQLSMLQKIGIGFILALFAMTTAGWVEEYRISYKPTPGNYSDPSARANISPCQRLDDYNPFKYQEWVAGVVDVSKPSHCRQICSTMIGNISSAAFEASISNHLNISDTIMRLRERGHATLDPSCITCDDIPQMSAVSVFWQIPQFALIGASEILASVTSLEFFYSQAPATMRSLCQSLNLLTTAIGSLLMIPLLRAVNSNPNSQWVPNDLDKGHLDWYFYLLAGIMGLNQIFFWWLSHDYEYKIEDSEQLNIEIPVEEITSPISHSAIEKDA